MRPGSSFSSRMAVLLLGFSFVCASCASSASSRFYQLSSLKAGTAVSGKATGKPVNIEIGPVRIPDYLDRPQIVTSNGKNELELAEFDRWAGSLDEDIARVVAEDISALLPADRFRVTPWSSWFAASPLYQVEVNVIRFEGAPGKSVLLKAQWTILDKQQGLRVHRESVIAEDVHGATYRALVTAMSNALAGLSRAIAGSITSL